MQECGNWRSSVSNQCRLDWTKIQLSRRGGEPLFLRDVDCSILAMTAYQIMGHPVIGIRNIAPKQSKMMRARSSDGPPRILPGYGDCD